MITLDQTDNRILSQLMLNARIPVSEIAKELGLARTTVQARIDRMEQGGVIAGYTVRLSSEATARTLRAMVLAAIDPRATPAIISRLKAIPQVEVVRTTAGRFDLAIQVRAGSTEELDKRLDQIGEFDGVRSTESLIYLSTRIDRATGPA